MEAIKSFFEIFDAMLCDPESQKISKVQQFSSYQVFKSKIVEAKQIMHGKTSIIKHNNKGVFKGIKKTIKATRYHSLIIDRKTIGKDLIITAETVNKTIMGIMHKKFNVHGVQFHPESIKTPDGIKLLKNFLKYN